MYKEKMDEIEVYSFFAGMGILDLGFEKAGFNITFVNEINSRYLEGYKYLRKDFSVTPKYGFCNKDINYLLINDNWDKIFGKEANNKKIIGFIGGPPCPDFSKAGKNAGESGEYGQLTDSYIELILKRKPDFFVFENVSGLYTTKKHRTFYEKIKSSLRKSGYAIFDSVENALWYGVPQDRERLIMIGFKKKTFGAGLNYTIGTKRIYEDKDIENAQWPSETPFKLKGDLECPDNIIKELTVQSWFQRNDVYNHPNCNDYFKPKNMEKFMSIPEGHSKGKSFKRLHRWRYSPTAAYGNNEVHLHPYLARRLSVSEVMAIQSLPREASLPEDLPLSVKFKMIGNGVPFLLSYGIAKELMEWLINIAKEKELPVTCKQEDRKGG